MNSMERFFTAAIFFCVLSFPALCTGFMFTRAWCGLPEVTCFSAFTTDCVFPALGTGCVIYQYSNSDWSISLLTLVSIG